MKKMSGIASSLVLLTVLAGCSPGDRAEDVIGAPTAEAGPENLTQATQMERKLPRGMQLNFPHHLLRDGRLHDDDSGESQRLVRVEYLDMDREEVIDSIDDNFTDSNYEATGRREMDNGDVQLRYEHERADLAAIVTVREGGKLEHGRANGLVVLTFPPKSEPDPEDGT